MIKVWEELWTSNTLLIIIYGTNFGNSLVRLHQAIPLHSRNWHSENEWFSDMEEALLNYFHLEIDSLRIILNSFFFYLSSMVCLISNCLTKSIQKFCTLQLNVSKKTNTTSLYCFHFPSPFKGVKQTNFLQISPPTSGVAKVSKPPRLDSCDLDRDRKKKTSGKLSRDKKLSFHQQKA